MQRYSLAMKAVVALGVLVLVSCNWTKGEPPINGTSHAYNNGDSAPGEPGDSSTDEDEGLNNGSDDTTSGAPSLGYRIPVWPTLPDLESISGLFPRSCQNGSLNGDHDLPPESPVATPPVHSPINEQSLQFLARIAGRGPSLSNHSFMKIGDSHSYGVVFLGCFAVENPVWGEHGYLLETAEHFSRESGILDRASVAAIPGIGAGGIASEGCRLVWEETEELSPRFALLMLGTNETGYRTPSSYSEDMLKIVDGLIAAGIIPLLSTIPPIDRVDLNPGAIRFNGMIRAIASSRSLPLVDLYAALQDLPDSGLREDGVHLSVDWRRGGGEAACHLDESGLTYGANTRNLLTLQQLDRARRVLINGEVPDPEYTGPRGLGTAFDPLRVPHLPFGDGGLLATKLVPSIDLPETEEREFEGLPGFVYQLILEQSRRVDILLHLRLGATGSLEIRRSEDGALVTSGQDEMSLELSAGRYQLVLRIEAGRDSGAEYLLSIL